MDETIPAKRPTAAHRRVLGRQVAGVGLAFLFFEIVLRFLAYGSPILDPQLGWTYRGAVVRHLLSEGHGISHWDQSGNRESPFRPPTPSTWFLAIGDSMTEALQVSDSEVYTARLEFALNQAGWSAAVLNAGRSSLSVADYIAAAPVYRERFHPAWTIVQLRLDDLTTDSRVRTRTHFIHENGRLAIEVVPPKFGRVSALLFALRQTSALADRTIARASAFNAAARLPPMFRGGDSAVAPPVVSPLKPRYPIEEELAMLSTAWAGRLTIALIPDATRAEGNVEDRSLAYCRETGISVVDMRNVFSEFERGQSSPFGFPNSVYGEGHLNRAGHEALAMMLATELKALRARGLF